MTYSYYFLSSGFISSIHSVFYSNQITILSICWTCRAPSGVKLSFYNKFFRPSKTARFFFNLSCFLFYSFVISIFYFFISINSFVHWIQYWLKDTNFSKSCLCLAFSARSLLLLRTWRPWLWRSFSYWSSASSWSTSSAILYSHGA